MVHALLPRLVSVPPPGSASASFIVPSGGASLGRRASSTIHIDNPRVSALQCLVMFRSSTDGWCLVDRGSNSTRVNGVAVGRGYSITLMHGDVINCSKTCDTAYRFEFERPEITFWRTCPWSPKNRCRSIGAMEHRSKGAKS